MEKRHDGLLGSGAWYFVDISQKEDNIDRFILDESEYQIFFKGLDADGKFIKVGKNHYFWSKIDSFGPIEFDEGVITQIKTLPNETQDFIKKRIRAGVQITTLDKLRSEVAFYNSK